MKCRSKTEVMFLLLKKELEKLEKEAAEVNMDIVANQNENEDELYDLDDFVLEINMYNKEDICEE